MFESAEIGHAIDKETYDAAVPALREALLEAQFELQQQKRFPVIILINGIEGAGKGETVKLLNEWMDPRLIEVRTFDQQTDEELARPPAWRYWRMLPAKGRMGIFFGNWYSQMLQGRVHGLFKDPRLDQAINAAERLEKMLCDEGALIFKFWFHLSKKQMKARLKALADDPLHSWRISPLDWQQSQTYDKFVKYGERVLRRTSRDYAPWHVIEGVDANYRSLAVGKILLEGLQNALKRPDVHPHDVSAAPLGTPVDQLNLLDSLDLTQRLEKKDYEEQLITEQARLSGLMRDKRMRRHALVAVFEGNDAAGKGGAIRRVAAALDPRQYTLETGDFAAIETDDLRAMSTGRPCGAEQRPNSPRSAPTSSLPSAPHRSRPSTTTQLAALGSADLNALTTAQFTALTTAQVASLTTAQSQHAGDRRPGRADPPPRSVRWPPPQSPHSARTMSSH